MIRKKIPEEVIKRKRLGRHVAHDPKSRQYPFKSRHSVAALRSVNHKRYGILNQGNVGSCTGNAVVGALNTDPIHPKKRRLYGENKALEVYSLATELDPWPGIYPPEDTGSSGLDACKAAQQLGLLNSYRWAFSMEDALSALQIGPVITGVNWYEGFDKPSPQGVVRIAGEVRGGHEFEIVGFVHHAKLDDCVLRAVNSWGPAWGLRGRFSFTVKTWKRLLDEQGDCTIIEV